MSAVSCHRAILVLTLAAVAACASDGFSPSSGAPSSPETFTATTPLGPVELPDTAMHPVAVSASAPAPVYDTASFYARNDQDRSVSLFFANPAGSPAFDGGDHEHDDGHGHGDGNGNGGNGNGNQDAGAPGSPLGSEYVRLTVWKNSLLAWPDGRPFVAGDSVLITVRLVDRTQLLFEFEPSGLRFTASKPAELRINYGVAGGDLNQDGQVDAADSALVAHFGIWHQATAGGLFLRLASAIAPSTQTVRADIPGFSRYAVSY